MKPHLRNPWHLDSIEPHPRCVGMSRDEIAAMIEQFFKDGFPDYGQEGACLYWTYCASVALRLCGHRVLVQAGSMHWPILPQTELERPTHFGYEFDLSQEFSQAALIQDALPEVHCWVALPDALGGAEIVDFSTRTLKHLAETRHGLTWEMPGPPRYLWAKAQELPLGVIYAPSLEAIAFVFAFIERKTQKREVAYA